MSVASSQTTAMADNDSMMSPFLRTDGFSPIRKACRPTATLAYRPDLLDWGGGTIRTPTDLEYLLALKEVAGQSQDMRKISGLKFHGTDIFSGRGSGGTAAL